MSAGVLAAVVLVALGSGSPQPPNRSASAAAEADRIHTQPSAGPDHARRSLRAELAVLNPALVADPESYDLLWRAARAENQLATHLTGAEQKRAFDRAIALGKRAVEARPDGVEGHYWLGASYGRAAEARGGLKAFFLARRLRGEMKQVVRLQPDYEGGDAFLALGELERGLPGFLGGDDARGLRYFEEGLRVAPGNADLKLALARAYLDAHRVEEARRLLEELVAPKASGPSPDPSLVREARKLLESLPARPSPSPSGGS